MQVLIPGFDPEKTRDFISELEERISKNQLPVIYEKYADFFKWTTTIALGAILWLGVNSHSIENDLFLILSLFFLLISIISSIGFMIWILRINNDEVGLDIRHKNSLKSTYFGNENKKEQNEVIDQLVDNDRKQMSIHKIFGSVIVVHGLCLILGITCFVLAIIT